MSGEGNTVGSFVNFFLMQKHNYNFFWSRHELLVSGGLLILTFSLNDPLSAKQKAIILGNVIGDGHLQLAANEKSARLRFTHTLDQQQYVQWQYKNLTWLCEKVKKEIPSMKYKVERHLSI